VAQAQQIAIRATPVAAWTGAGEVDIFIVQAVDDVIAPPANAEALQTAYPERVTVTMLPNAGHAMLPEQPDRTAELVLEGLSKLPRQAAPQ
jgi:pimeloyl-ACP methyl ester carboxylesterase